MCVREREGWREGEREREGGREGGRKGGREGGREKESTNRGSTQERNLKTERVLWRLRGTCKDGKGAWMRGMNKGIKEGMWFVGMYRYTSTQFAMYPVQIGEYLLSKIPVWFLQQ